MRGREGNRSFCDFCNSGLHRQSNICDFEYFVEYIGGYHPPRGASKKNPLVFVSDEQRKKKYIIIIDSFQFRSEILSLLLPLYLPLILTKRSMKAFDSEPQIKHLLNKSARGAASLWRIRPRDKPL